MKKLIKSSKLMLAFTLMFIFSIAGTAASFAIMPKEPVLSQDKFVFIDTHIHTEGIGEVGGRMMIDFPTYSYSSETKTLRTNTGISNYGPETKVFIGSGKSLSGTAGGGASTVLRAYSSFSSPDVFYIDSSFSIRILMNGEYRVVPVGEKWTETVETKPAVGDGKLITTYTIQNYGVLDKANFLQPIPVPTKIASTPTPTPTSVPTPSAQAKKFKVFGYVRPEPMLVNCKCYHAQDFKVEIPELNISTTTDEDGYFKFDGVPENNSGYKFKVSKIGCMTRTLSGIPVSKDVQIGTLENPISILSGDIDNNGAINISDVIEIGRSFNSTFSDPNYNKAADLDYNEVINMSDVMILATNFNKSTASYKVPLIINLNYITMAKNKFTDVVLKEGGLIGLTWKYSISNEKIIKFDSKTSGNCPYPDAYFDSIWTFKAISTGEASIMFTPSRGYILEEYIIKVTDTTQP